MEEMEKIPIIENIQFQITSNWGILNPSVKNI